MKSGEKIPVPETTILTQENNDLEIQKIKNFIRTRNDWSNETVE